MSLIFQNVSYAYGQTPVLSELNFEAKSGQITCLLGPSGGGKSTLLRLAAGLEPMQQGSILVDGQILCSGELNPPPEARPVGLMFQENALFPTMSVADNIAFGIEKLSKTEQQNCVQKLLAMVGLPGFENRMPHELSGGQQQRIALARSLAPEPKVLLMDEPYASIDITLRRSLREAARKTLKEAGATCVLVTHDPDEAMEMADVIAVLDEGVILQAGSPQELYLSPQAATVAALFGGAQRQKARRTAKGFEIEQGEILADVHTAHNHQGEYELVFRPHGLHMQLDPKSPFKIVDLRFIGESWLAFLLAENASATAEPLRVALAEPEQFKHGDRVTLRANNDSFYVYEKY